MFDINSFLNSDELFDGHYRLLRPLSTDGASADVWLALDVNTIDNYPSPEDDAVAIDESSGIQVAIKIYRPKNALDIEGEQRFRDEFKVVYECRHANLLQPTGFSIYKDIPYLVLPYCEAGSSENLIGQRLSKDQIWKFVLDVASGLNRLHTNYPQIIHQDIKPANILIDNNGNYTITDFGISSRKNDAKEDYYDEENNGTFAYMAPERFEDANPRPESDIWALGATLCEIITSRVPFGEDGGKGQADGIHPMPALRGLPTDLRNLIHACLQKDPKKRPTALQIMELAQTKLKSTNRKALLITLIALVVLLIGGGVFYLTTNEKTHDQPEIITLQPSFDLAKEMLLQPETAADGLVMLDTLIAHDNYQAIFLKSRLFFQPGNRDRLYEPEWESMRNLCNIVPNNETAHELLYEAFKINENDYKTLYFLGCDYKAGYDFGHGCTQNLQGALWCFDKALSVLQTIPTTEETLSFINEINEQRSNIQHLQSIKPKQP